MEPKIEIYDDYCVDMGSKDIQTILSQITALVTDAVLRATAQKKDEDDAAYLTWEGAAALAAPLSYPPIENTINKNASRKE